MIKTFHKKNIYMVPHILIFKKSGSAAMIPNDSIVCDVTYGESHG